MAKKNTKDKKLSKDDKTGRYSKQHNKSSMDPKGPTGGKAKAEKGETKNKGGGDTGPGYTKNK